MTNETKLALKIKLWEKVDIAKKYAFYLIAICGFAYALIGFGVLETSSSDLKALLYLITFVFVTIMVGILLVTIKFDRRLSIIDNWETEQPADDEDKLRMAIGMMTKAEEVKWDNENTCQA